MHIGIKRCFQGLKERFSELGMKGESLKHMRRLKKYEEGFSSKEFSLQAQEMVIEAHRLLQEYVAPCPVLSDAFLFHCVEKGHSPRLAQYAISTHSPLRS